MSETRPIPEQERLLGEKLANEGVLTENPNSEAARLRRIIAAQTARAVHKEET